MKSAKPKVLLFTDWYLPGYKAGGPIRSCANLVDALGNEVDFQIVCSDRDYLDTNPYADIQPDYWCEVGKARVMYLSPGSQTFGTIRKILLEHPDHVIYINGIFSKVFSVFPLLAASRLGRFAILAPRGMLAPGALGLKRIKKQIYLKIARKFGLFRSVTFHATNADEAVHIQGQLSAESAVEIIPNLPTIPAEVALPQKESNAIKIVCVARIAREKNIEFALECLAAIPADVSVEIRFIGSVYDTSYFENCSKLAAASPENVQAAFVGSLPPKELFGEYERAHLFFLPTLGENYGHAIVEALLSGTPALISDQTPWKDLERDRLGADFSLDNSPKFTDFIVSLAKMDNATYQENFNHIAEKVEDRIDLNDSISKYKTLFQ